VNLPAYPCFSAGGDPFDRLTNCPKPDQIAVTAPGEVEALAALHAPVGNGVTILAALPALLNDTGQHLIALGQHFRASE